MRSKLPVALLFAVAMPFMPHPPDASAGGPGEGGFHVCMNSNFCIHCVRAGGRCSLCSAQRVSTSVQTSKSPYKKRATPA